MEKEEGSKEGRNVTEKECVRIWEGNKRGKEGKQGVGCVERKRSEGVMERGRGLLEKMTKNSKKEGAQRNRK